ncbi:hypothetical protein BDQ12DRAFT_692467 [Crucibulum laeve]|uniref:Uncharacterized protein n=1 Tax=Crucibulum laeve TaxID=68775 RepID=A0A5C3LHY7_9AGAR|nr:hypothetical protein BDQ12DRAFT_692467 [Crucibulum laeve]
MSKVILVTGSNTGIGLDLVRVLAEKGHTVYLSARNEAAGKEAQEKLKADGLYVKFVRIDVTDGDSIAAAKNLIKEVEGKLDVLVNNAAVSEFLNDSAVTMSMDTARRIFDTNFFGLVQVTTAFIPLLQDSGEGVITNVTSGLGSNRYRAQREDYVFNAAYSASKAAVNSYTIALARELKKDGIKVNAVSPGFTATKLNNFTGTLTVREGTEVVLRWVLLDKDGLTGQFGGPEGLFTW